MRKIIAIALTVIGTPLELYFYWFRFTNEGMAPWVAIVAGVCLTVLLATFIYLASTGSKGWLIPAIVLFVFDVISTSAGQSFASLQVDSEAQVLESRENIARDKQESSNKQLALLTEEYETLLQKEKDNIAELKSARAKLSVLSSSENPDQKEISYCNATIARLTKEADKINKDKNANQARRDSELVRNDAAFPVSTETGNAAIKPNIYRYYQSLFGFEAKWIQFGLHTLLSIFLAIMPSVGVLLWSNKDIGISKTTVSEIPIPREPNPLALPKIKKEAKTEEEVAKELEAIERATKELEALPDIVDPRTLGHALEMSHTPIYYAIKSGTLKPLQMNPIRISKEEAIRWWSEERMGVPAKEEAVSAESKV